MEAMITQTTTIFYPPNPLHDDVAVVAALYEQPYDVDRPTGKVLRDGTCSCGTFKLLHNCRHVDEYEDCRQTCNGASYRQGVV